LKLLPLGWALAHASREGLKLFMSQRTFSVKAVWDPEARVYYCESDIFGLHIETETLDDFEEVLMAEGVNLILANHVSPEDLASKPLRDLVPAIVWQRPEALPEAA
jgi:Domain of unknown function (DUF1902)